MPQLCWANQYLFFVLFKSNLQKYVSSYCVWWNQLHKFCFYVVVDWSWFTDKRSKLEFAVLIYGSSPLEALRKLYVVFLMGKGVPRFRPYTTLTCSTTTNELCLLKWCLSLIATSFQSLTFIAFFFSVHTVTKLRSKYLCFRDTSSYHRCCGLSVPHSFGSSLGNWCQELTFSKLLPCVLTWCAQHRTVRYTTF